MNKKTFQQLLASLVCIFKKETIHMRRNAAVLVIGFILPFVEFLLLGYILDTNVRQINTVVYDVANTQESRQLINQFTNTNTFHIVARVSSDAQLYQAISAGDAKVGIKIPVDYSQRILDGSTASVLVIVDGSNATLTSEAINVSSRITLQESVKQLLARPSGGAMPSEARVSVLFNPEMSSPNFFLPGLLVFELTTITVLLVALSITGERERGTLEQLSITPVDNIGMMLGKILPYGILAFIQLCELLFAIRYVFHVPIRGSILLLMLFSIPFIITELGLGLIVSAKAESQMDAVQLGIFVRVFMGFYLTGYVFPLESTPAAFQVFTKFIPHRYYMEVTRGIIIRGAEFQHLWMHGVILVAMSIATLGIAALIYRKKI